MLEFDRFKSCHVVVVGDIALDRYVNGEVTRISPEAPVPVLHVQSERAVPGCAANVAANIAAIGARSTLVGLTGKDAAAAELISILNGVGRVQLAMVATTTRPTTVKTRYMAAGQQVMRADCEHTAPLERALEDELLEAFVGTLAANDVVVVSDYKKGTLTDRVLEGIIASAKAAGKPIIVDPKRLNFSAYRGATIIKPNRSELGAASGLPCETDDEVGRAAEIVMGATGAMVLLTRSEQGMSLFRQGADPIHLRTEAREVFDVSGAGDTVAAVIAAALAAGLVPAEAMKLANAAAGIVVSKRGTATVTCAEISKALGVSRHGLEGRILSQDAAVAQREAWRRQGFTCGFTNGCFDLLHPGHISLLTHAKAACDRLIVALNSDSSVRRLKGPSRPIQDEDARAYVMAHIEQVDGVVLFDEDTPLELITALKPDVLIKGADYCDHQVVGADMVKSYGGKLVLAELVPNQSTTRLAARPSDRKIPLAPAKRKAAALGANGAPVTKPQLKAR